MRGAWLAILVLGCGDGGGADGGGPGGGVEVLADWNGDGAIRERGLVTDETHVYWLIETAILRVPKGGGTPEMLAELPTVRNPTGLAVDDGLVFWGNNDFENGAISVVPATGGAATVLADAAEVQGVAVDDEHVYWTQNGDGADGGQVLRVARGGGAPEVLSSGHAYVAQLAIDATHVYFVDRDAGSVARVAKDGSGVTSVLTITQPLGLALDDTRIYVTTQTVVVSAPLGGGDLTMLATGQVQARDIAASDTHVYWTDTVYWNLTADGGPPDGAVRAIAKTGGQPSTVAAEQNGPHPITVDATHVYWIEQAGTRLVRAPLL